MNYFITFGGGSQNYLDAANRLANQAKKLNLFDKIILYTDKCLENDKEFWEQHSHFIKNNERGYGYWVWKPYIIKKTMSMMKQGDKLLYLDCGCEIDIYEKNDIVYFLKLINSEYIIGSVYPIMEKKHNKMDLILKLDMLDEKYLISNQHQACAILFLICDKTINIVNEWYDLACCYHNIDDTPSITPNLDCFIEHRHDQSIFSILTKKYSIFSNHSLEKCICISRNNTGFSKL